MQDMLGLIIAVVELGVAGGVVTGLLARRRYLQSRQRDLQDAERALVAAGFHVERVTEQHAGGSEQAPITLELTRALIAERAGGRVRIERTRRGARCTLHFAPVRAVSRVTFDVRRQHFVGGDITVGDKRLDDALSIGGWPKDRVAAVLGQPAVRAALEKLFAREVVDDVALVALVTHDAGGAVRVRLRLPFDKLGELTAHVDDAKALAAALDDAMWVDEEAAQHQRAAAQVEGATSSTSGAPFAVPVKR